MSNYDFSGFHPACKLRGLQSFPDGMHVYCLDCGVSANIEAISAKISPEDACLVGGKDDVDRQVIGDQSFNVHKGEVKKR